MVGWKRYFSYCEDSFSEGARGYVKLREDILCVCFFKCVPLVFSIFPEGDLRFQVGEGEKPLFHLDDPPRNAATQRYPTTNFRTPDDAGEKHGVSLARPLTGNGWKMVETRRKICKPHVPAVLNDEKINHLKFHSLHTLSHRSISSCVISMRRDIRQTAMKAQYGGQNIKHCMEAVVHIPWCKGKGQLPY